jgi:UDP-glucose 6-dehydrogenase
MEQSITAIFMEFYMLKYVGYIGFGTVGKSCHRVFKDNSEAIIIDPIHSSHTWDDFQSCNPKLTFVSLPADTLDDGSVDSSVIYEIFDKLSTLKYDGIVVLKSTLPPVMVRDLATQYGNRLHYVYSPEFIREQQWEMDATRPKFMILAGDSEDCKLVKELYMLHSCLPDYVYYKIISYEMASLVKYSINSFLATKVTFMNELHSLFFDVIPESGNPATDWMDFVNLMQYDSRIGSSHMSVPGPDGQYGYGGKCLPKDMKAMVGFDTKNRMTLVRDAIMANTTIRLIGDGK